MVMVMVLISSPLERDWDYKHGINVRGHEFTVEILGRRCPGRLKLFGSAAEPPL